MPDQVKQDSNSVGLRYAEEQTPGVLKTNPAELPNVIWYPVEPNEFDDMGSEVTTRARAPINASRQRQKGAVVDVDAPAGFSQDFIPNQLLRPMQGFFFANAHEKVKTQPLNGTQVAITGVTATDYEAAIGAQLDRFLANDFLFASGFTNPANNGVKQVTASTDTTVAVAGLQVEGAPPTEAQLEKVGVAFTTGDIALNVNGVVTTLDSTAYDFTTIGLNVGEFAFIKGFTDNTNNNVGYIRIREITTNQIRFDLASFVPAAEAAAGKDVEIYFGTFLRNEKDPTLIVCKSVQFERTLGRDNDGTQSEYGKGQVPNELTVDMSTADFVQVSLTYVGMDFEYRAGATGLKPGVRPNLISEETYNTSTTVFRSIMYIHDDSVIDQVNLFAHASELTMQINNGVEGLKAIGTVGNFAMNIGDFEVSGEGEFFFSTVEAIIAVRNNADVGWNIISARKNEGFVLDLPLLGLGDGKPEVEKDEPIMLPLETNGAENEDGYTLSFTNFSYLPDEAMPTV